MEDKITIADGGRPPKSLTDYIREDRMEWCLEQIKKDPTLELWWEDPELMIPTVITKEAKKAYDDFFKPFRAKMNIDFKGKIICFGTGGEMDKGGKSFED